MVIFTRARAVLPTIPFMPEFGSPDVKPHNHTFCSWLDTEEPRVASPDTTVAVLILCAGYPSQALAQLCGVYCKLTIECTVAC